MEELKHKRVRLSGSGGSGSVLFNGDWLAPGPSQAIRNHSPDGFAWGYGGSGPSARRRIHGPLFAEAP